MINVPITLCTSKQSIDYRNEISMRWYYNTVHGVTVGWPRSTSKLHTIILFSSSYPQLMSVVSSERYWKDLLDVHNPGVLEIHLDTDKQCYTNKVARSAVADRQVRIFYWVVVIMGIVVPPYILYITWWKQLAVLEQVKVTKGGPAVMWACIAWMPLANLYFTVKLIATSLHFEVNEEYQRDNEKAVGLVLAFLIIFSSVAAVIQSGRSLPGLPNTSVLKSTIVSRVVKFHIWTNFNVFLAFVLATSSFVALLVGTNPFLYGSALLAIVVAASLPILLTATLFTIGQDFLRDPDFRLTWREAMWQAGRLLLVTTGCAGVALFLGCICFLLLLSKGGDKVQSVSGVASFLTSHVVLTALPLLMHSLIRFIRNITFN